MINRTKNEKVVWLLKNMPSKYKLECYSSYSGVNVSWAT